MEALRQKFLIIRGKNDHYTGQTEWLLLMETSHKKLMTEQRRIAKTSPIKPKKKAARKFRNRPMKPVTTFGKIRILVFVLAMGNVDAICPQAKIPLAKNMTGRSVETLW